MRPIQRCSMDSVPSNIRIMKELSRSDASSIFEVELDGEKYAMKLFHDNGDPGFAENGRDLNRFRCELNAYMNLRKHNVCKQGFVPYFHGHIDRINPSAFQPALRGFACDKFHPRAILLEYLPDAESLNCENYSDARYQHVIDGMKQIHKAHVHHQDIYPKNILIVPGARERVVWVDFDVATTFPHLGPSEKQYSEYEDELVAGFGEALREDQKQGLRKNTKFY
ncbi:hypothetical protein ASPZODRAFT_129410 [Penicilliopsis zonata CBS 506.65]|uniref:Protein kinase domain-containing protein n=1 Tax=Penicilliopsis zonata CBS 506.65 TaxID=1073090 RepID=A0A1L9SP73_9EURO|nr:hypothetical protein ASPZODRAFT_129410 [Penicilliopsis zonata CBS 506.65]OJJ49035.1 hypothetical protein ASPZODRAFT_129410 [Penicilliopsis zonata CBS 506.65]